MQSPSSLIFLVLLGVWAAYFVQYWVRRRDHVATARSVEQFSEAMRVLERRDPLPRTDFSEQAPRSYAVHPARANRPQMLVKRAVAAEHTGPVTVTARVDDRESVTVGSPTVVSVSSAHPASSARPTRPAAAATGASSSRPAAGAPRPSRTAPVRPELRPSRRVRGLIVLTALAELVVIVPLVALSMLPGWALGTALVALVGSLAFVRSGARAEHAMMAAHRRRQADLARLRSSAPATAPVRRPAARPAAARTTTAPTADTASAPSTDADAGRSPLDVALEVAPATPAGGPVVESTVLAQPAAEAREPAAVAPAPADAMVPILDDDDMPLTWDPVPVPRPTYTMKAKAERREVPPAAVTPDPAPVVREESGDDTAYDQRRFAGA